MIPAINFQKENFSNKWITFQNSEKIDKIQFSYDGVNYFETPLSQILCYQDPDKWGRTGFIEPFKTTFQKDSKPSIGYIVSLTRCQYVFRNIFSINQVINQKNEIIQKNNEQMAAKLNVVQLFACKIVKIVMNILNAISFDFIPKVDLVEKWKQQKFTHLTCLRCPAEIWAEEMKNYFPNLFQNLKVKNQESKQEEKEQVIEQTLNKFYQIPTAHLEDFYELSTDNPQETLPTFYSQEHDHHLWLNGCEMDKYRLDPSLLTN
ncbi:MAG: hypothetical protein H0W88_05250 [Parachlamydiaceae bacterium]|nr:hypothetical protein [Parachlamydiaceae bacterium]